MKHNIQSFTANTPMDITRMCQEFIEEVGAENVIDTDFVYNPQEGKYSVFIRHKEKTQEIITEEK